MCRSFQISTLAIIFIHRPYSAAKNRKYLHALGFSLTSVLASIRTMLSEVISFTPSPTGPDDIHAINSLWFSCSEIEERLEDMVSLCGRVRYTATRLRISDVQRDLGNGYSTESIPSTSSDRSRTFNNYLQASPAPHGQ